MATNAPEAPPTVAVGSVCVRDGAVLLVRRSNAPGSGQWALPGGRVEAGETLAAAVRRELAEETGLSGKPRGLCGVAERRGPGYHYVILNYWVDAPTGRAVAADDVDGVVWATRADLETLDLVGDLDGFLAGHGVLDRLR